MKRWLILALGTLLILILSYIAFLNKKESITHGILSQAQTLKENPAFKDVYIKLKGEGFALTREIILLGNVSSKEEKALASNLLKDIKGITKINNLLKVQTLKPIIKEVESIDNENRELIQEREEINISTTEVSEENNSSDLNTTIEDSNISTKDNNNTAELNSTNQQAVEKIDTNLTKENNETNQSSCQEELDNILSKRKIQFAHNSSNIEKSSYQQLNQISTILKECSKSIIVIDGYSDNRGNPKYNQRLSQQRANKVKLYLISKGIDKKSIKAFGHGAQNPIASNDTKEGREKNRRIEFTIKKIK